MRKKPASSAWFAVTLCLTGAFSLIERFRTPDFLNAYDDDAFYYFQIARNIVEHHRSTFDNIHPTNGYHPLWMAILVGLNVLARGRNFFILVQLVAAASLAATFLAMRNIFRMLSLDAVLTDITASAIALQCLLLIRGGMEVTLTLPLIVLTCWYRLRPRFHWSPRTATIYGVLCALAVLSRLDAAIFVATLFLLELLVESPAVPRLGLSRAGTLLATLAPLFLYALSNHHWFHTWMPISGEAKQLRLQQPFIFENLRFFLRTITPAFRLLIVYPALLALLASVSILIRPNKRSIRPSVLIVSLTLLIFPAVQMLTYWALSDWPIWSWYLYSFPLAIVGALILYFNQFPGSQVVVHPEAGLLVRAGAAACIVLFALANSVGLQPRRWNIFAADVQKFAQAHKGIYAMGDCAGTAGYLIHQPLVQLEGLVMDAPFLDNIRQQRDLDHVLSSHSVRYYITADAKLVNGCYITTEPGGAGPAAPHMRGQFCQLPLATFVHSDVTLNIFDLAVPNNH